MKGKKIYKLQAKRLNDDVSKNNQLSTPKSWLLSEKSTFSNGKYESTNYQKIVICHTDENYANYHRSIEDIERNNENPFAEPLRHFSNVKGGFGVFAGYNRTEYLVENLP